ncbi:MAG: glutamate racemase [Oscillospiraceae bacterium]|nr:glutamate racemase [Oscillospiraceae bacterium]
MDKRPIGVFDSGLGGLTAVRELRRILPGEDIVYFGDTGRVPYGTRSRETILQYTRQDLGFLLSRDVKFIMAACGTVSSTYPAEEAARLPVPFLGVVEAACKAAAAATRTGHIGVVGTPATIRSGSYARLLEQLMPGVQITARPCALFVPLVENGRVQPGDPVTTLVAHDYLDEVRDAGVDTLIMGCTHYPLLEPFIREVMGPDVTLIDPGRVTAAAARETLERLELSSGRSEGGTAEYFVSDTAESFDAAAHLFLGRYAGGPVTQVPIETW